MQKSSQVGEGIALDWCLYGGCIIYVAISEATGDVGNTVVDGNSNAAEARTAYRRLQDLYHLFFHVLTRILTNLFLSMRLFLIRHGETVDNVAQV